MLKTIKRERVVVQSAAVEEDLPLAVPLWKAYLALTKPRIISLLLFTTLTALFIAPQTAAHHVTFVLFWAVALGGYMSAGAANAINMVIDRDIDARMERTAQRPTVTQRIPASHALLFALALESASFAILTAAANLLTACLALAGLLFYVFVYTLLLKRRTWHNIVIGGAAGAFPPLVGYAAVTGNLSPLAWVLFGLIFVWTPVHFWALALLIKDEYADAGIPMLPVVRGDRMTVLQILLYMVLTVGCSLLPLFQRQTGWLYLGAAVVLNAGLIQRTLALYRQVDRPQAKSLFKFSMLYLALLFLLMAVDRSLFPALAFG
jgi:protoheme IX farnesyltransferase